MSPVAGGSTRGAGRERERGPATGCDRFAPALRTASAPIALWALHFALMYAGIAVGCRAGADAVLVAGLPVLQWALLGMTAPVAAWLGWTAATGIGHWLRGAGDGQAASAADDRGRAEGEGIGTGPWLGRVVTSVFALVAVIWETVPVFVLPLCGP
jgi:hypothetical protein